MGESPWITWILGKHSLKKLYVTLNLILILHNLHYTLIITNKIRLINLNQYLQFQLSASIKQAVKLNCLDLFIPNTALITDFGSFVELMKLKKQRVGSRTLDR